MLAVKIPLKEAEVTRKKLLDEGIVDVEYQPKKEERFFYIPVLEEIADYEIVDVELEKVEKGKSLREILQDRLSEKELDMLKTSYDIVGGIAILEIDKELRGKEKKIAEAVLESNHTIRTVVRKSGAHEGELRIQDHKVLAGEDSTETIAVENGTRIKLDINKVYYSARSSTERKRIAEMVQDGERVLVMFSGAGPFVCVIGKKTGAEQVVGVELNEDGARYCEENIKLNKLNNAKSFQGDVRDIVPELGEFDRVIMPLPHTAKDFLDLAVPACTKHIHLYHFSTEEEVKQVASEIPERIKTLGKEGKVVNIQKCGDMAPGIHRWCIDIEI